MYAVARCGLHEIKQRKPKKYPAPKNTFKLACDRNQKKKMKEKSFVVYVHVELMTK
jgi:hypothetical protein